MTRTLFQLVRLPNVFTAAADSLAGWLLVMGTLNDPGAWIPLVLASMAIYAGGMVLNDVCDYRLDVAERPERPLPSGRITRRSALILAIGLLLGGIVLAGASGSWTALLVSAILVGCVVAYDALLKPTLLGPEIMGVCRGLNLLLGMSHAEMLGGPGGWLTAGAYALFVTGLTWISRSENQAGRPQTLGFGMLLENFGIASLMGATFLASQASPTDPNLIMPPVLDPRAGVIVLLVIATLVNRTNAAAWREPVPANVRTAVRTGILCLVWLNAAVVLGARGWLAALVVAIPWVLAYLTRRLFAMT